MGKLKITETVLRDGHQSLIATRLKTSEMIPMLEKLDNVGYHSLEVWGGATFDSCIRYLNEDPWERLRTFKKYVKNTNLQMLLRGQNILGYKHYPDDIVDKFIEKAIENGITIVRVFDALNDVRNLETSIKSTKKYGAHCQGSISYTTSKIHTIDYYIEKIKEMEELGVDSICIKDMSGILLPNEAFDLVTEIKNTSKLPVEMHSHCTSGTASMMYLKSIEAGVDIIDTSLSPLGGGTAQPATEVFAKILEGTNKDPELNIKLLEDLSKYLKPIRDSYMKNGILKPKVLQVEPRTLIFQIPGGMLSNLLSQLEAQNASDKYDKVLEEVPKVRKDMGYPPLVTPLSQMVGTQAVMNVLSGERYKMIPKEIKDYVKGLYGKSPAKINDEVKKKIIGNEDPIDCRPADNLEPAFSSMKKSSEDFARNDEDVLTYGLFPEIGSKFLKKKYKLINNIDSNISDDLKQKTSYKYNIKIDTEIFNVEVEKYD